MFCCQTLFAKHGCPYLRHAGVRSTITEDAIIAAVDTNTQTEKIVQLLLSPTSDDFMVTESFLNQVVVLFPLGQPTLILAQAKTRQKLSVLQTA